jgi:hypothetical protein
MKIAFILIIYSLSTFAAFQEIWKGYQTSFVNELRKIETENVENNLDYFLSTNPWKLKLSYEYDDTFLDALFSFQSQQTIKETQLIGIEKNTFRFGNFSYTISQTRYDLSNWASGVGNINSDEVYETRATFLYTYDLLKTVGSLEEKRIVQNNIVQKSQNSAAQDKEHLDFFKAYLNAKLSVFTHELAQEMKKRANTRLAKINRRVKDGLSRKVESYQAQSSLLKQNQEVYKAKASLKESVAIVELVLRKSIPQEYFKVLKWDYHPFKYWSEFIGSSVNYELKTLEERIRLMDIESEKLAKERGHSLILKASYVSNAFNENISDSFSEATSSPENDSKIIGLEYTIPFGSSYSTSKLAKMKIDKKRAQYQMLDLKDKIKMNIDVLEHNIDKFENAYELAKKQVSLTKKIMDEQNKLYLRGLATFDDVIRAEESYINATLDEKRILHSYENLIVDFAYYNGSVVDFFERYTD